jgi:hypothetical protein
MLVPAFLAMFVVVQRSPVLLYRSELRKGERLPFALYSATELPMVVAISEIALRLNIVRTEIATALIGAGLLSVLLFPAIPDATLRRWSGLRRLARRIEPAPRPRPEDPRAIQSRSNCEAKVDGPCLPVRITLPSSY